MPVPPPTAILRATTAAACLLLGWAALGPAARAQGTPPGCTAFTLASNDGTQDGGSYYQCTIDTARFPDALCNDGSPGIFQVQPASVPSTKWVIWLAGGAQCQTQASCTQRARSSRTHQLVTSRGAQPRVGQGLLSHDPAVNPDLADANTVEIRYCSSDAWVGGQRAGDGSGAWSPYDVGTWHFLGRAIVKAAVASLGRLDLGFLRATEVVFGGTSAGGFGATMTANDVFPLLPEGATTLFVQDVAFTLSLGRFDATAPSPYVHAGNTSPFQRLIRQGRTLWGGRGDRLCDAAATTEREHLACLDATVVVGKPWIASPIFVANAVLDTPTVQAQICPPLGRCQPPHDPGTPEGTYTTFLGKQMADALTQGGAASLPYTAFAPNEYVHPLLNLDAAFTQKFAFGGQPRSARDTFSDWYRQRGTPGRAYVGTAPGVQ